jgi:tetratricopeptide (TPR) repeat protein
MDEASAARACLGLGETAVGQGHAHGAAAWYTRGIQYAGSDPALNADLLLGAATVSQERGQSEDALDLLRRAREAFQILEQPRGTARALHMQGRAEAQRGDHAAALASYREALSHLHSTRRSPRTEMSIRLSLCELYLDWGRLPDAEDEIRRTEELAIVNNLTRQLARLYILMGKVRGRQGEETGFVFFEKAIELCRGREPSPRLEAEAYMEYGLFRKHFGDLDEARAYLERAREILDDAGNGSLLARVDAELATLPAF